MSDSVVDGSGDVAAGVGVRMKGELFRYGATAQRVAFQSGAVDASWCVVMIGGLGDGMMATGYVPELAGAVYALGGSFVQPLLDTSFDGFSTRSLHDDVDALDELLQLLIDGGMDRFWLVGHSTGCQDSVLYSKRGKHKAYLSGIFLQAPVSDREYMATLESYEPQLEEARRLVAEGRSASIVEGTHPPMCAERFLSLGERLGLDDMFSSDLSSEEMLSVWNDVSCRVDILWSTMDEYVPLGVDVAGLLERFRAQEAVKEVHCIDGDHGLSKHSSECVEIISGVIAKQLEIRV